MVLTVRVVWPEFGDEKLQQLIREHPDDLWRVDVFPNFVTYRRQIDALKTVCIKGYLEPKPSAVVRRILASLISDQNVGVGGVDRQVVDLEGAAVGEEQSGGDDQNLPAADNVPARRANENLQAARSDLVLPSDVVADEAPEDEPEVSRGLPSVGEVDRIDVGLQQLQLKPPSHKTGRNFTGFQTERRQRHSFRRVEPRKNLNESQRLAVEAAVNEELTVIQGPPGTGKTKTAAAIVKEWLSVDEISKVRFAKWFIVSN